MKSSLHWTSFVFTICIAHILTVSQLVAQPVDSVITFSRGDQGFVIPHSASISPADEISVSFWFKPSLNNWSNKPESLLSKRASPPLSAFSEIRNWEVYDATNQSSKNDVRGFVGAVFDGRYVYCSPWWKGGEEQISGKILRYDTHKPYADSTSWLVYDAESEDGHEDIRGLEGAVFDGRYVYYVPLHHEGTYFSKVLRYDTQKDFQSDSSWDVYDAAHRDEDGMMNGFVGAVFDGSHIYFIPNPFVPHARVLRYSVGADFVNDEAWQVFDLTELTTHDYEGKGFFGGIFDGKYLYFVPFTNDGMILRFNTELDFLDKASWSTVSIAEVLPVGVNLNFAGAAFDGRYLYMSPIHKGTIVRFDTRSDFFDPDSWDFFSVLGLDSQDDVLGGVGPTFDGRFVYFPPMYSSDGGRSGKAIVYDTHTDFHDSTSWNYIDLTDIDPDLKGFEGAVYDGQYVYFVPMNFSNPHGKIVRYNTLSTQGLSYEITYNQSSSSFGSVLQALNFKIGTSDGLRSLYLTDDNLADDVWHHIVATYDGFSIRLFLDGELKNSRTYDSFSGIVGNTADLYVGSIGELSESGFTGQLNELAIWNKSLTPEEVEAVFYATPDESLQLQAFYTFDEGNASKKVVDLTVNRNDSDSVSEVSFLPLVSAGSDEFLCADGRLHALTGAFPDHGFWTGPMITASGIFEASETIEGRSIVGTFNLQHLYGTRLRTFSATKVITLHDKVLPEISLDGVDLVTDVDGYKYEWFENGLLLDNDSSRLSKFDKNAGYQVRVLDHNGCYSYLSEIHIPLILSVEQFGSDAVTVYPNPSNGAFEVMLDNGSEPEISISIADLLGRKLLQREYDLNAGQQQTVDITLDEGIPGGVYIIQVKSGLKESTGRIVVNR